MGGGGGGGSLGTGAPWPTLPATVPVRKAARVVSVIEAIRGGRIGVSGKSSKSETKLKTRQRQSTNFQNLYLFFLCKISKKSSTLQQNSLNLAYGDCARLCPIVPLATTALKLYILFSSKFLEFFLCMRKELLRTKQTKLTEVEVSILSLPHTKWAPIEINQSEAKQVCLHVGALCLEMHIWHLLNEAKGALP